MIIGWLSLLLVAPSGARGPGASGLVLQTRPFIAIFYFNLIRPQRPQRQEHDWPLSSPQLRAKGVGLAANQIGVARRVAVVDIGEDPPPLVLINPVILERGDEHEIAEEGCLSIPEIFGDVERHARVVVDALDSDGKKFRAEALGYKARAIQHEIDHLDGILFLDHLSAVKRSLLLAKWKKSRKGQTGYLKEVTPEPAGEL